MTTKSLGNLTLNVIAQTGSFEEGMDRAERKTLALNNTMAKMVRQIDPLVSQFASLNEQQRRLSELNSKGVFGGREFEILSARLDSAKNSAYEANSAFADQYKQINRVVSQLDPAIAKYAELDNMQARLSEGVKIGLVSPADYDTYSKKIAQMRNEVGKAGVEYDKTGKSAKELAFATRGLPAQFTDIAVSLQAGQNPMTVFLQQGGQLKDMFGGVGPAAKAMGGYIMGLINPFTVAATAAGVMALAYYQGSIEADRLRNALILTGNSAGTTTDQLMDAAKRIDAISGTQRQAAAALAEVAKTGKFFGDQIELVGLAAIKMENVTGKAMSETIAEFVKLADDPVKAAEELNKKYNFLTGAVYEQAAALKEAGKSNEAAELVFKAYSDAIDDRTSDITENLGYIEQAWKAVKEISAEAWDAAAGIGRRETIADQIAKAKAELSGLTGSTQLKVDILANTSGLNTGAIPDAYKPNLDAAKKQAEILKRRIEDLELQQQVLNDIAEEEAERAKISKDSIAAQRENAKLTEETLTNEQKRTKAIKEYKDNIEKIRKDNPNSALLDPDTIKRDLASIEKKFKDTAKAAFKDDAATSYLMRLRETQAGLQGQLDSNTKLTQSQKELLQFEQQIADIKNKDVLTAQQKSLLAEQSVIRAQLEKNVALDEELKKRNEALRLQSYSANLAANLAAEQQRNADKLASFGLGDKAQQRLGDRQSIERDIERAQGKALSDNLAGRTTAEEYQAQLAMLKQNLSDRLAAQDEYYIALDAKQADWTNGARSSMQNYIDAAADMAGQTEKLFDSAFGGMTDALTDFVTTGKADSAELTKSILSDLAKISMQKAIAGIASNIFGGFAESGAVGYSSGGYTGAGGKYEPAGIVHRGEVVWSQRDVARAGGVATVEAMRKGNKGYADGGVAGGAAYNGVPAAAMAGAGVVHVEVNIDQSGNATTTADTPALSQFGSELGKFVEQKYRELLAKDLRPNGQIGRTIAGGYR
ncbi:phage tail tape measure protein [Shewanella sp. Shew256]|uniref:phage tail tape measure protein n=1 Tax=Shewanella sp. Shew256 TaxID=1969376 RepID=UPI0015952379|nr:phage tail tape measure protein [Shewanella sp. Shew256]